MPVQQRSIVLVVDVDQDVATPLQAVVEAAGHSAIAQTDFQAARSKIREGPIDALIANVRLGSFNGIHLAYAARHAHPDIRVLIYASQDDPLLARETQRAGAFYERQPVVPLVLERFLAARLPSADRRDVKVVERRAAFRGGRRSMDVSEMSATLSV